MRGQGKEFDMKRFEREMKQPLLDDTTDVSISVSAASPPESAVHSAVDQVTVCWGDILPWLVDAIESKRSWVHDFDGDQVQISRDLHDVICAYRHYRGNLGRPASNMPIDKAA